MADEHSNGVSQTQKPSSVQEIDFVLLLNIAVRTIPVIIFMVIAGFVFSWLYLRYTQVIYRSSCLLQIETITTTSFIGLKGPENNLSREIELIKSKYIIEEAVIKSNWDVGYYSIGKIQNSEIYTLSPFKVNYQLYDNSLFEKEFHLEFIDNDHFRLFFKEEDVLWESSSRFGEKIKDKRFEFTLENTQYPVNPGTEYFFKIKPLDDIIENVTRRIVVGVINAEAKTVKINYDDNVFNRAVDFVNTIAQVYISKELEQKTKATEQSLKFITDQMKIVEKEVQDAEAGIQIFKRQNNIIDPELHLSIIPKTQMQNEDTKKAELELKLKNISTLIEYLKSGKDVGTLIPVLSDYSGENMPVQLLQELSSLQKRKQELSSYLTENHHAIGELNKSIASLNVTLTNSVEELQKNILQKRAEFEKSKNVDSPQNDETNLSANETDFMRLKRKFSVAQSIYELLLEKEAQLAINKSGITSNTMILEAAKGGWQIYPDNLLIYSMGPTIGILLGFLIVVIRYLMNDTVNSRNDIERLTKLPIIGLVTKARKESQSEFLYVIDHPKSLLAESLRAIRSNLDFIAGSEKCKVISISSTVSREGKTFIAANLSAIIAMAEKKVICLDLDLRRPKLNLAFGLNNNTGMSNLLSHHCELDEAIIQTKLPNLNVITSGPIPPNPSELILSQKFSDILSELKNRYSIIIIDTPPLGMVTDGMHIFRHSHVGMYVIRLGFTKRQFLNTLNILKNENQTINFSLILNAVGYGGSAYGYGYGYGSRYGYGYGYGHGYGYGYGYGYGSRDSESGYYADEENPTNEKKSWLVKIFK